MSVITVSRAVARLRAGRLRHRLSGAARGGRAAGRAVLSPPADRPTLATLGGVFVIALSGSVLLALGCCARPRVSDQGARLNSYRGLGHCGLLSCADARGVRAPARRRPRLRRLDHQCRRHELAPRHEGAPWRQVRASGRIALPASVASVASYLLILWVWSHAPIAPAAALRDTSALLPSLSPLWLKEPFTRARILAVLRRRRQMRLRLG